MFRLYKFFVIMLMVIAAGITADQVFGLRLGTERITEALRIAPILPSAPKIVDPETVIHPQEVQAQKAAREKGEWVVDGVKIDGRIYPYNPRNLYVINGVPTYYDPGRSRKVGESAASGESVAASAVRPAPQALPRPGQAAKTVEIMAEKAPLSVYSPQGVSAVMDGARDAARVQEEKERALEVLGREGASK